MYLPLCLSVAYYNTKSRALQPFLQSFSHTLYLRRAYDEVAAYAEILLIRGPICAIRVNRAAAATADAAAHSHARSIIFSRPAAAAAIRVPATAADAITAAETAAPARTAGTTLRQAASVPAVP